MATSITTMETIMLCYPTASAAEVPLESQARADATRRVERKIGFFVHLGVYLLVNSGLIPLNLLQTHHRFWAFAPLLGWGIGLLFHGLKVFVRINPEWKRRMVEEELSKN